MIKFSPTLLKHEFPRSSSNVIINRKSRYSSAAVLIPLIQSTAGWEILFQVRHPDIPQGGEICFPGGGFQEDSDSHSGDTAVRETSEELGIPVDRISVLGFTGTLITAMGAAVDAYVGILDIQSLDDLVIQRDEVDEVFTLPVDSLLSENPREFRCDLFIDPSAVPVKELELPPRYHGKWGPRSYPLYFYKTDFGPLWGITAEVLRDFLMRVQKLL